MARLISTVNHPDGSNVTLTNGQPLETIYTSNVITIPPNSGVSLSGEFGIADSASGYVAGTIFVRNADTDALITEAGNFVAYSAASGAITSSFIQNSSGAPLNIKLVLTAASYMAVTTTRITGFKTTSLELYPKEAMGQIILPDSNVSYPGYGHITTGSSGSSWSTICTINIPAGNMITFLDTQMNFIQDGTAPYPIFEFQVLENGIIKESYTQNLSHNQNTNQYGLRYSTQTSEATSVVFRSRVATAGAASSIGYTKQIQIISLDLDKIGTYVGDLKTSTTPLTANPIFQTPTMNTTVGNKLLYVANFSTNADNGFYVSPYHGTSVNETNLDIYNPTSGRLGNQYFQFTTDQVQNLNPRGFFGYVLINHPVGANTASRFVNWTWINQTLRPGSALYIFDLSADVAPPIEYEPNYYLEIS